MTMFLHTGLSGELAAAKASGDNSSHIGILDAIVTDVGSGVGQWSLYDDLRTTNQRAIKFAYGTQNAGSGDVHFSDAGSSNFFWDVAPNTLVATSASGPWHTVSGNPSSSSGNVSIADTIGPGEVISGGHMYRQARAIVLKCTSAIKPFYVLLEEYGNSQVPLQVSIFETWDSTAHAGTNQSPVDWMRSRLNTNFKATNPAFNVDPMTIQCQYILSLKDEALMLWTGGDPSQGSYSAVGPNYSDLYLAQTLDPDDDTDTDCVLHVPSCTFGSGRLVKTGSSQSSLPLNLGGAALLRSKSGQVWATQYIVAPKGLPYYMDADRGQQDSLGRVVTIDHELIHGSEPGNSNGSAGEVRRGKVRNLKTLFSQPGSNFDRLAVLSADGITTVNHILLYATAPSPVTNTGQDNDDVSFVGYGTPGQASGGFAFTVRYNTSGPPVAGSPLLFQPKWFAYPMD